MRPLRIDLVLTVKGDGTRATLELQNKVTGMKSAITLPPDHIPSMAYIDLAESIAAAEAERYTGSFEDGIVWARKALENVEHTTKTYRPQTYKNT